MKHALPEEGRAHRHAVQAADNFSLFVIPSSSRNLCRLGRVPFPSTPLRASWLRVTGKTDFNTVRAAEPVKVAITVDDPRRDPRTLFPLRTLLDDLLKVRIESDFKVRFGGRGSSRA